MSLSSPAGPINPEDAQNNEEIEMQFAVKGMSVQSPNPRCSLGEWSR